MLRHRSMHHVSTGKTSELHWQIYVPRNYYVKKVNLPSKGIKSYKVHTPRMTEKKDGISKNQFLQRTVQHATRHTFKFNDYIKETQNT